MDYPQSEIIFVYFLYVGNKLVYIGRSTNIINRLNNHRCGLLMNFDKDTYKAIIYGPYPKTTGHIIESCEIVKRLKYKHFLGTVNNNYGYEQKDSVKNNGQKTTFYFKKDSRVKKVVGQHSN